MSSFEQQMGKAKTVEMDINTLSLEQLMAARTNLMVALETELTAITGVGVDTIDELEFKGKEKLQGILGDRTLNLADRKKALSEVEIPLLLRMGTLAKIKNFMQKPEVLTLIAMDERYAQLTKSNG